MIYELCQGNYHAYIIERLLISIIYELWAIELCNIRTYVHFTLLVYMSNLDNAQ